MFKQNKSQVFRGEREGLQSHILFQEGDVPETRLAITWVDVKPSSVQHLRQHFPEQLYIIIRGKGRIQVGKEAEGVVEQDLIYIPSNMVHGIEKLQIANRCRKR